MYEIKKHKDELRREYSRRRMAIPPETKARLDAKICEYVSALASFRYSDTVLLYAAISGEIDVYPLARLALARGKKVGFPRCENKTRDMTFRFVSSLDELSEGTYRIPEPPADAPAYTGEGSAVCVVPALLFDTDGYRLGYGKGYYDRFLGGFGGGKIGLVYSEFLLPRVPRGNYDLPVGLIVTENGVRLIG